MRVAEQVSRIYTTPVLLNKINKLKWSLQYKKMRMIQLTMVFYSQCKYKFLCVLEVTQDLQIQVKPTEFN